MKHLWILLAPFCLAAGTLMTGCTASLSMPDPGVATVESTTSATGGGSLQGSVYGGHAPLVGAHVYLLQAGTGGYGTAATSLLKSGETATDYYGSTYPTQLDATGSGSPTNGMYYITTDSRGDFDLSNGYTCTAGLPVYIYAQGGNPETATPVTVTSINSVPGTGAYNGGTLSTFTNTGTNLFYQGEMVTFSGITGANAGFNGLTLPVESAGLTSGQALTTSQFTVYLSGSVFTSSQTFGAGAQASQTIPANAPTNPAVVNLAVLGICPSSGQANFGYLPFVYMNEVSTAAAAYALGGFFPAPGSSGLANAGAVAANLAIPASDNLALLGIQNAALTADQIYDILGSNTGTGGDGDTHIARTSTPGTAVWGSFTSGSPTVSVQSSIGLFPGISITGPGIPSSTKVTAINTGATPNTITLSANATSTGSNVLLRAGAGSGVVPQSLLNTVGNLLANCVDSANTYNPYTASGTVSSQCTSLFGAALSAGTSGTAPVDTASAAIDIAHNPWANVSTLAALPTGNEPFQPTLSSLNDFSVGIEYTPTNVNNPEGLAVDGQGRVWYPNAASGYVTTLTPFGGVQYNVNAGNSPDYIAIDGNGNAWLNNKGNSSLQSISSTGSLTGTYHAGSLLGNFGVSVDGVSDTGYIYGGAQASPGTYYQFNGTGATVQTLTGSQGCMTLSTNAHSAVDNATNGYHLWVTGEAPDNVCIVNTSTGAVVHTVTINSATGIGSSYQPEFPAIDASGNAWIPNQNHASISKITQAGTLTNIAATNLSGAFGAAVDGSGNIFVSNRTGNGITEFLGSTAAAVSTVNYYGGGSSTIFSDPLNLQVDPSGAIWISNYAGSRIVELLGVAAPTWEPLSDAAYHNKLGSKP